MESKGQIAPEGVAARRKFIDKFLDFIRCYRSSATNATEDGHGLPLSERQSQSHAKNAGFEQNLRKDTDAEGGVTALSANPPLPSSSTTNPVDHPSLPPSDSVNDTREIAGNGTASQERTAQDVHAEGNASVSPPNPPQSEGATPQESAPQDLSKKRDYTKLTDTVFSIVDFVLNGVQTVGSNLPGIGAVSVVLAATDKLKIDRANRKEMDKILDYIKVLCVDAGSTEEDTDSTKVLPIQDSPSADLIAYEFSNILPIVITC